MNNEAKEFRKKLRERTNNSINKAAKEIPKDFDMQYCPVITFIDDDPDLGKTIERILPSVSCGVLSIEDLARYISKGYEGFFDRNDLIFIDTFYRDPENNDRYAIDYFDMYRKTNNETITETQGKYKVVVSMDEMEERTKRKTIGDIAVLDENLNISKLWSRIKKHPILEYREGSSKVETIIKAIEEYAQENKIYLFKSSEMSYEEWIEYIKSLVSKVSNAIDALEKERASENLTDINDIICKFSVAVKKTYEILGLNEEGEKISEKNKIRSIEEAAKQTKILCQQVETPKEKLMDLGIEIDKLSLCDIAHNLGNYLLCAYMECYRVEEKESIKKSKQMEDAKESK